MDNSINPKPTIDWAQCVATDIDGCLAAFHRASFFYIIALDGSVNLPDIENLQLISEMLFELKQAESTKQAA